MARPPSDSRMPRGVTGLLIGRGRVRWCSQSAPELQELRAANGDFAAGELEAALRGLVAARTLRGRVAIGFEPELEFFATERKANFHGRAGGMLDSLVSELGQDMVGRELATSLAPEVFSTALLVPGGLAREARRGLAKLGPAAVRLISSTHAVYAVARVREAKQARRAEAEIRVLIGEGNGLALLTQDGELLARHVFEFSQAREFAVIAAVRRLLGVARDGLHLAADPEIVLHSDGDQLARLREELGVDGRCAPEFRLDAAWIAGALACCGFQRGAYVSVLQTGGNALGGDPAPFPYGGLAAAAGALAAAGFWMNLRAQELDAEIRNVDIGSIEVYDRFGRDVYELRDHEERLSAAAYLATAFAQDRVRWAPLLEALPRLLPDGMAMEAFEGSYPFWFQQDEPAAPPPADEIAANRWIELAATAAAAAGDAPPEVQQFTAALRESETLRAAFRRVTGAGVVLHEEDEHPWVEARVRCLAR